MPTQVRILSAALSKKKVVDIGQIRFIVKKKMRYDSLGDWYDSGKIDVYTGLNKTERLAVAVHELIEMALLHLKGVRQKQVDKWDTKNWTVAFNPKMYDNDARYKAAHRYAEKVERKIIETAGINWKKIRQKSNGLESAQ
ncbi:MAG: hypothetical protein QXK08_03650 [Candidatus Woesearchaeota archaeon]